MTLTKRTIVGLLLVIAVAVMVGFIVTTTFLAPIYVNYAATGGMPINYVEVQRVVWA